MMAGDMELDGRVALVTGGGRRLGKGISKALAGAGCLVVIHYGRSREAAEATVGELAEEGCDASSLGADLADVDQIAALFGELEKRFGRLDILVNSAASFEKRPLIDLTNEAWDRVMAVNLRAPFLCTRYAAGLILPKYLIPTHYGTFEDQQLDLEKLEMELKVRAPKVKLVGIKPGESFYC